MASKLHAAPKGFAAQLITAIEEAQAAAAQQKPGSQLAQAAWDKLQYDFPVVAQEELAALVEEYASGGQRGINSRFLGVLRESACAVAPIGGNAGSTGTAPPGVNEHGDSTNSNISAASKDLVPLYQQLYAVAVVQSLCGCLQADEEAAAAAELADLQLGGSMLSAEGDSQLEQILASDADSAITDAQAGSQIELEHRLSQQEDEDGAAYEPLELQQQPEQQQQPVWRPQPGAASSGGQAGAQGLPQQLAELAGHLSYHCMGDAAAWRELRLMQRLVACVAAVRQHERFLELKGVVQPMLRLATDRMVAVPLELEAGLPAVLDTLGVPGRTSDDSSTSSGRASSKRDAAAAAATADLALAVAVALAVQLTSLSAHRWLWQEVQQRLLPLAAQQLEAQQVALARQARGCASGELQASPQRLYSIALPCQLLYFYVLHAPAAALTASTSSGGASSMQEALLRGGLLRSLVLLFVQLGPQPGAELLRCALLLACATAQPLVDWVAAVPGFTAATAALALQSDSEAQLHGALWQVLLGSGSRQLAALVEDARPASKVPAAYHALQLMADMQAVSRRPQPLWDAGVNSALRELGATLREQYSKLRQEEEEAAAGAISTGNGRQGGGSASSSDADEDEGDEDEENAKKLAVGPEEQSELLAVRRAQQLQPACLKLIKDLLQRQMGGGCKHD